MSIIRTLASVFSVKWEGKGWHGKYFSNGAQDKELKSFSVTKQNTTSATTVQNTVSEANPTPWESIVLGAHALPNESSHKKDFKPFTDF